MKIFCLATLFCTLLLFAACGKKGDLTLPSADEASASAAPPAA